MAMSVYSLIRQAIIKKQQVVATYDGYVREMCPHVIGTKDEHPQALFYQFGGGSKSGLGPAGSSSNWRCIPIEGLSYVSVREGPWHSAPTHSQKQTCVDLIDVEVSH